MGGKYNTPRMAMYVTLLLATAAFPATAPAADAAPPHEYVVWVDALNLREGPSTKATVLAVLREGTRLAWIQAAEEPYEEFEWRRVKAGDAEGWVADRYVLRADIYDAFKEADERGKAGDAAAMSAAAVAANRTLGIDPEYEDYYYSVSPDGEKLIVEVADGLPYGPQEVLYFANGRGLVDHLKMGDHIPGRWDATSRYYAYAGVPVGGWRSDTCPGQVALYDTTSNEVEYLGWCLSSEDFDAKDYQPNYWPHSYEFAGGYLIWYTVDEFKDVPKPYRYFRIPALYVYDLKTKTIKHVLRGDITTIADEAEPGRGWDLYKIQMNPSGSAPPAVERSKLYKKYDGAWAYAWESQA
ncbi:MAG: SH3 domain-containing protein [Candidatus Zixiibacteriota bacterium]|jgi:uncharacterized protein YraI